MNTIFNFYITLILFACIAISNVTHAQVGIYTQTPEGALDLNTSTQGLVYPRIALSSTIVAAPVINPNGPNLAIGTTVYNTFRSQTGANDVFPGLYVWDGGKWVGQFIREDYRKYDQSALVRPTRRTLTNDVSNISTNSDAITGLVNQTFTPKYSGKYKIKVSTNFGAGQMTNFYPGDAVSMSSTEGDFVFFLSGTGVSINPAILRESFENGWIYTHAFGVHNKIENPNIINQGVMHYSSVVYTENLIAGLNYTFSLRVNNYTGNNFTAGAAGLSYVGRDLPCSIEFTYVAEQ